MLEWIEYKEKTILRMDVDRYTTEQYLEEIRAARCEIVSKNPPEKSVLFFVCGRQPSRSPQKISAEWAAFIAETGHLIKAQAVAGLDAFRRTIARLVSRDVYFAKDEQEAKDWLLEQ